METIQTVLAIIVVAVIGFFFLKRIVSCLWRAVTTVILLVILGVALHYLGVF